MSPWKGSLLLKNLEILKKGKYTEKVTVCNLITITQKIEKFDIEKEPNYYVLIEEGGNLEILLNSVSTNLRENKKVNFNPDLFVLSFFVCSQTQLNVFPDEFNSWIETLSVIDLSQRDKWNSRNDPSILEKEGSIIPFTMKTNWYNASLSPYATRDPTIFKSSVYKGCMNSLYTIIQNPQIIERPLYNYLGGLKDTSFKNTLQMHYEALVNMVNTVIPPEEQERLFPDVNFNKYEDKYGVRLYPDRTSPNMTRYTQHIYDYTKKKRESKTIIAWNGRDRFEERERSSSRTRGRERERDRGNSDGFTN